jgi:hypothetical protein
MPRPPRSDCPLRPALQATRAVPGTLSGIRTGSLGAGSVGVGVGLGTTTGLGIVSGISIGSEMQRARPANGDRLRSIAVQPVPLIASFRRLNRSATQFIPIASSWRTAPLRLRASPRSRRLACGPHDARRPVPLHEPKCLGHLDAHAVRSAEPQPSLSLTPEISLQGGASSPYPRVGHE